MILIPHNKHIEFELCEHILNCSGGNDYSHHFIAL